MQLHQLKARTVRKPALKIGRGGKRGKTSGRGTKGQKARSGHRMRPELRDIIKKLPKNRGYRFSSIVNKPALVKVSQLEVLTAGSEVTPKVLLAKGLIKMVGGLIPKVKILAGGELTKKLQLSGCAVSAGARAKILAAGGVVQS